MHWTWPTHLLNAGGEAAEYRVGCHNACSSIFQSCAIHRCPPPAFPAMSFFAEEFSDRAFAAVHQRAGDLPANHSVPSSSLLPHLPKAHQLIISNQSWNACRTEPKPKSRSYLHHPSFKLLQVTQGSCSVLPSACYNHTYAASLQSTCASAPRHVAFSSSISNSSIGKAASELSIFPGIQPKVCLLKTTAQCSNSHVFHSPG